MDIKEETKTNLELLKNKLNGKIICPMCQGKDFFVVNGFFRNYVQEKLDGLSIGRVAITTVVITCKNCGFVSQHALSILRDDME